MEFKIETLEEREARARATLARLGLDETATAEDVFAAYDAETQALIDAENAAEDELAQEQE